MTKSETSRHSTMVALAVMAVMVIAGGAAIASNAGFKLNRTLLPTSGGGGQLGHHVVSIPYFNPYPFVSDFCAQVGLPNNTSITYFNPATGNPSTVVCGFGAAALEPMSGIKNGFERSTQAFRIIVQPGSPASGIIVGSHNPTASVDLPAAGASGIAGQLYWSVPYHTTATNWQDICDQLNMTTGAGSIRNFRPAIGTSENKVCGFGANTVPVTLGDGLLLRNDVAVTFTPAHF